MLLSLVLKRWNQGDAEVYGLCMRVMLIPVLKKKREIIKRKQRFLPLALEVRGGMNDAESGASKSGVIMRNLHRFIA